MVCKVEVDKRNNLGYGICDGEFIGRTLGYDVYAEYDDKNYTTVWVYDCSKSKRFRAFKGEVLETRYRIAASIELYKERGAWEVAMVMVDSRYKGKNLAAKLYKFLLKKMDITLMAGSTQSPGGRYVWNKLAKERGVTVYAKPSRYSMKIDFPKSGKKELYSDMFDLYDSNAEIFAVAA